MSKKFINSIIEKTLDNYVMFSKEVTNLPIENNLIVNEIMGDLISEGVFSDESETAEKVERQRKHLAKLNRSVKGKQKYIDRLMEAVAILAMALTRIGFYQGSQSKTYKISQDAIQKALSRSGRISGEALKKVNDFISFEDY